jgi:NitT/TauT family transport system permease protein
VSVQAPSSLRAEPPSSSRWRPRPAVPRAARGDRLAGRPPSAWSRLPTWLRRTIVFVVLVAFWQVYVSVKHVSHLVFSSPASAISALVDGWRNGQIASATGTTMEVLVIGMAIGLVVGLLFTVAATVTTVGKDFVMMMTAMINPLPSIAILPLAIIWFGLNDKALIFVIALAVVWPMAINMSTGFTTVNPTLLMAARNLGLRGWRLVRDVLLPAALPYTMSGIKVSWAFGWRTVIAAELVFGTAGGSGGLGYYINNSQYFLKIPDVFAGLITIAVIGIAVETLLNVFERRTVVRWGMQRSA